MTTFNEGHGKHAVAKQSLKRFEEHKDNPMVQALTRFITTKLERTLEQVASWGIEVSDKPSRTFYLLFTDGERFEGRLEEVWQVRVFVRESEKVLPISPYTSRPMTPHGDTSNVGVNRGFPRP